MVGADTTEMVAGVVVTAPLALVNTARSWVPDALTA